MTEGLAAHRCLINTLEDGLLVKSPPPPPPRGSGAQDCTIVYSTTTYAYAGYLSRLGLWAPRCIPTPYRVLRFLV